HSSQGANSAQAPTARSGLAVPSATRAGTRGGSTKTPNPTANACRSWPWQPKPITAWRATTAGIARMPARRARVRWMRMGCAPHETRHPAGAGCLGGVLLRLALGGDGRGGAGRRFRVAQVAVRDHLQLVVQLEQQRDAGGDVELEDVF